MHTHSHALTQNNVTLFIHDGHAMYHIPGDNPPALIALLLPDDAKDTSDCDDEVECELSALEGLLLIMICCNSACEA